MYDLVKKFKLENSVSSLYDNLDILVEKDESESLPMRLSFVTISKTQVDILHCYDNGETSVAKVIQENAVNKCFVLQAKWCHLSQQSALVVATYKGVLIFDCEGQLLMFWHNLCEDSAEETSIFCRGIACVQKQYICVGTSDGRILVLTPHKNSFAVSQTLDVNGTAICSAASVTTSNEKVDFVCGDDSGVLCTYKSGSKFRFVSHLAAKGEKMPCTALHLLPDGLVVAGYMNGKIRIFDTSISVLLAEISAHARVVSCLDALSLRDDHYTVISGSEDSFIRVWRVSRNNTISVVQDWYTSAKDLRICGVRFCDAEGRSFVATGYDLAHIIQFSKT